MGLLTDPEKNIQEYIYYALCAGVKTFGAIRFERLYTTHLTAQAVFRHIRGLLGSNFQFNSGLISGHQSTKSMTHSLKSFLFNNGIRILPYDYIKTAFPHIYPTPIMLYARGNLDLLSNTRARIAIVGTRKPTPYGVRTTQTFARSLAQNGGIIVSGLALGVDSLSHEATLEHRNTTIGVLGSGLLNVVPHSHEGLADNIISQGGLLLSEFTPLAQAQPGHFVARNRIVAGISNAVLVIEGSATSGTLITSRNAFEYDIPLFAIPGTIDSPLSYAPHFVIKNGGILCTQTSEIIEYVGPHLFTSQDSKQSNITHRILEHMQDSHSTTISALVKKIPLQIHELLPILTRLELDGFVKTNADGTISRGDKAMNTSK